MNMINTSFDELIREGIIISETVINKDKINLISGTITAPLIETIWAFSGNNIEVIRKILETRTQLYSTGRENEMLDILQILYYIVGMEIPKNINLLTKLFAIQSEICCYLRTVMIPYIKCSLTTRRKFENVYALLHTMVAVELIYRTNILSLAIGKIVSDLKMFMDV